VALARVLIASGDRNGAAAAIARAEVTGLPGQSPRLARMIRHLREQHEIPRRSVTP
jgi:hypothetical protein